MRMNKVFFITISALVLGCGIAQAQRGTPEEQNACSRDASRFCRHQLSEGDDAVQQCLEHNRDRLGRACRRVFQAHGM
jgi:hypothetical protein